MKVLLVGHSHAGSIKLALAARTDPALKRVAACDFEYSSLKREPLHGLLRDSKSQLTSCGRALSERLGSADALVLSLEGNWHNAIGMVERGQRYDFFGETDEAPPDKARQIIPRPLMAQAFTRRMESVMKDSEGTIRSSFLEVLAFVHEHIKCPSVLVEPPPIPDPEKIVRFRSEAVVSEHDITPLAIRQKLWRLQSSLIKQYCDRFQVEYLPVQKEIFDADGNLDPRAYEGVNDPTHMGPWYGQFVVRQIDEWLGRLNLGA